MKKLFIVANWKSNKSTNEAKEWLQSILDAKFSLNPEEQEAIVCPPYPLLPAMNTFIKNNNLPVKLGTQDISSFAEGAYTGSVSAKLAAEYVTHAIIGHSERRKYFHETDEDVLAKIKQVLEYNITPILCISDIKQLEYYLTESTILVDKSDKIIFVFEPPSAISGGGAFHADDPMDADKNAAEISTKIGKQVVTLYGGSVNPDNAKSFFALEHIAGGLIGQASLDPQKFMQMIKNA
jgi:triosephosphate isomerase (TIM)